MQRRLLLTGIGGFIAAPAISRTAGILMPVRSPLMRANHNRTIYANYIPKGLGDGSSPLNAASLYDAFILAKPRDRIVVLSGNYGYPSFVQATNRGVWLA